MKAMTTSKRTDRNTRDRELYHWYKDHHICVGCHREDAMPGRTKCEECSLKEAEKKKRYRERDKSRCLSRKKRLEKSTYAIRREKGLCVRCGKASRYNGNLTCIDCTLKNRREAEEKRQRKRKKTDFRDGLCACCNNPVVPGHKLCEEHYRPRAEIMRKVQVEYQEQNEDRWRKDNKIAFYTAEGVKEHGTDKIEGTSKEIR